MINIRKTCRNLKLTWDDAEMYFDNVIMEKDLTPDVLDIMKRIDGAEVADTETRSIKTPFGVTDISNLSAGCKTVIAYIFAYAELPYYKEIDDEEIVALDVTCCGSNALEVLFEYVDRYNDEESVFVLRHGNFNCRCDDYTFNVNGKICSGLTGVFFCSDMEEIY